MEPPLEEVVASALGCDASMIDDESSPDTLSSWDSVAMLNIILAVETAYGIRLSQADLLQFDSMKGIKRVLGRRRAEAGDAKGDMK